MKKFLELNRQEPFTWRDTQPDKGMKVVGAIGSSVSQKRCFQLNSCRYWQPVKRPEKSNVREFLEVENKQYFESPRGVGWQMLVVRQYKRIQKRLEPGAL